MDYLQILAATAEHASSDSEEPEVPEVPAEASGGTSANGRRRKRRMLDGEPVQLPVSRPKDKDERIKARNRRAQQRWRDKQKVRTRSQLVLLFWLLSAAGPCGSCLVQRRRSLSGSRAYISDKLTACCGAVLPCKFVPCQYSGALFC